MIFDSKKEAILYCSKKYNLEYTGLIRKISYYDFIEIMCKKSYNLKELGVSAQTVSRFLKEIFPDRTTSVKPCVYLLSTYSLKYCPGCDKVCSNNLYFNNASNSSGLSDYCRLCSLDIRKEWYQNHKEETIEQNRNYRLRLIRAIPKWADIAKIRQVYLSRPEGYHVDHIIPLKGEVVCGLHVHNNLQYMTPYENLSKGNRYSAE